MVFLIWLVMWQSGQVPFIPKRVLTAMGDINRNLQYHAAKEDPYRLKKKSVRGGSWKDPESFIRSAWRTFEYQNQPRSYIGFRREKSCYYGKRKTETIEE